MSENFQYKAGLHNVGSYQVSGIPFVTGNLTLPLSSSAPLRIDFPSITSEIIFTNHANYHARIGFSATGVTTGTNYYLVEPSGSYKLRVKASSVFLCSNAPANTLSNCTIAASLTGINVSQIYQNWSPSVITAISTVPFISWVILNMVTEKPVSSSGWAVTTKTLGP